MEPFLPSLPTHELRHPASASPKGHVAGSDFFPENCLEASLPETRTGTGAHDSWGENLCQAHPSSPFGERVVKEEGDGRQGGYGHRNQRGHGYGLHKKRGRGHSKHGRGHGHGHDHDDDGDSRLKDDAGPAFGFTGLREELDGEMWGADFRHLRPGLGRWAKRDPAGDVDGPNLYQYVNNNPSLFTDPSGLIIELANTDAGDRSQLKGWFEDLANTGFRGGAVPDDNRVSIEDSFSVEEIFGKKRLVISCTARERPLMGSSSPGERLVRELIESPLLIQVKSVDDLGETALGQEREGTAGAIAHKGTLGGARVQINRSVVGQQESGAEILAHELLHVTHFASIVEQATARPNKRTRLLLRLLQKRTKREKFTPQEAALWERESHIKWVYPGLRGIFGKARR